MTSPFVNEAAAPSAAEKDGADRSPGPKTAVRELSDCRKLLHKRRQKGHATAAAARLLETAEGFILSGNYIVGLGYVRRARRLLEAMG